MVAANSIGGLPRSGPADWRAPAPPAYALNSVWRCDGRLSGSERRLAIDGPLSVDGHVHYHVIPPVLSELLALCAEYSIRTIRLPREPLYWPITRAPRPPVVNVVKNVVLRALCRRAVPALQARSMETTAAFVGVLATGAMTMEHVRAALDYLRQAGTSGTIEILFHPGRARPEEASLWRDRPDLAAFYLSANRDREAAVLCSDTLGQLLRAYNAPAKDAPSAGKPGEIKPASIDSSGITR